MSRTHAPHRNSARVFDRGALGTEDLGRLLLRLALGGVLFAHGLQKFTVMGVDQVGQFFASLGLPAPELARGACIHALNLSGVPRLCSECWSGPLRCLRQ